MPILYPYTSTTAKEGARGYVLVYVVVMVVIVVFGIMILFSPSVPVSPEFALPTMPSVFATPAMEWPIP